MHVFAGFGVCDIYCDVLFLSAGETFQVREGRHLRDDSETLGESATPASSNVSCYRPQCAEQISGRIQRVCW